MSAVEGRTVLPAELTIHDAGDEDVFRFETAARSVAVHHSQIDFHHVDGDTDIPITFRRAIGTLNEGFEFHSEANMPQRVLKFPLTLIATIGGVGVGNRDFAPLRHNFPQRAVVELPTVGVPSGVVDILHVDEQADLFHYVSAGAGNWLP